MLKETFNKLKDIAGSLIDKYKNSVNNAQKKADKYQDKMNNFVNEHVDDENMLKNVGVAAAGSALAYPKYFLENNIIKRAKAIGNNARIAKMLIESPKRAVKFLLKKKKDIADIGVANPLITDYVAGLSGGIKSKYRTIKNIVNAAALSAYINDAKPKSEDFAGEKPLMEYNEGQDKKYNFGVPTELVGGKNIWNFTKYGQKEFSLLNPFEAKKTKYKKECDKLMDEMGIEDKEIRYKIRKDYVAKRTGGMRIGAVVGSIAGLAAGLATGPVGALAIGTKLAHVGKKIGDKLSKREQKKRMVNTWALKTYDFSDNRIDYNKNFLLRATKAMEPSGIEYGIYGKTLDSLNSMLPQKTKDKLAGTPFEKPGELARGIGSIVGMYKAGRNEYAYQKEKRKKADEISKAEFPRQYSELVELVRTTQPLKSIADAKMSNSYSWPEKMLNFYVGLNDKKLNMSMDGKYGILCFSVSIANGNNISENLKIYYDSEFNMYTCDYIGFRNHRIASQNWMDIKLKVLSMLKKNLSDSSQFINDECKEYGAYLNTLIKGFEKIK